ncbi:FMN-dependent NADH-azoreductase [Sneathiella limimaris]|uniref:FMN-dependent NADH-azoreductase n=1 Tax=Sneathiella limimaris TaxID=1964213 RepID=UPI00146E68A7|nr:FMN-dependent NADH-azoreductase [Sneathiella limimaris]
MTKILYLKSSILGEHSASNGLSQKFVDQYLATHSGSELIERDLGANPIPHLTGEALGGFGADEADRSPAQVEAANLSDQLIDELKSSDVIVLGLPMYNFGVPSALKAWIDYVAVAGKTFRYTEMGAQGLVQGKKVYIFATRGGKYVGTPADTQTGFMNTFLNFIGITDIEYVYAEGLALGEDPKTEAVQSAEEQLEVLAAA